MMIEIKKNVASESTIIDENRGRDDVRQNPKKRGTSNDVVASLDQRVAGVETSMAELKNQVEGLEGLDSNFTSMRKDFRVALNTLRGDLKREIHDLRDSFMGEIRKIREEFEDEVSTLHQVIEALQVDMALCKRSVASSGGNTNHGPKIDVPKPSPFVGKREARAVDDFLWEMEQYLEGVNVVDDASKITMATQNMKDTTALWWRPRYGDIEQGTATINTWAKFMADFKKQFYPKNAKNEANSRLRKLKQSGTIREYVKEFTSLVMEIPELSDQDSLFYFFDGLQRWAKKELERRGVKDLSTTIDHAKALIDFSTRMESSKPKDRKVNQEEGEGEKNARPKVRALVYSGATHNFVVDDEDKRLGINATKGSRTINAVNSPAKAIHGVAKDVRGKIGEWEGMIDLSVILVDDFKVVLGLKFLDKVRAFPMLFVNSLCILDGGKTCMSEPCYLEVTRLETDEGLSKVEVPNAIERVLEEFKDVMPKEFPKKLPLRREVDHTIELETGSKPPTKAPYRMPPLELEELRKQLKELIDAGYIRPSKAPYGAPVLFQRKKDESLWMCIDYRALNKVFQVLRDNELYVKLEKCSFAQDEVEYLGHKIKDGRLMMDGAKIKTIQDWEPPTKFIELRSFHGLVNYYQRFIMGYSSIASLLTDLLKKNKAWIWDEECQAVFVSMKKAVMEEPVLRLPIVTMPFELNTNASDFAVRGVLMQDGHPIAFKSQKLRDEKEEGLEHDPLAKKIIALAKDGRTQRFWLKGDMLFTKGDRLYVPKWGDLRREILKECHDSKWAAVDYEGVGINKIEQKKSRGLLEPLPTPKGPWEIVYMDFITCLPKSEGGGSIIVVVDRFSKYETFIAAPPDVMADDTAKLFFKNVLLDGVVQDNGDGFKLLHEFSSLNSRANEKGECTIGALSSSEATRKSPFELATGCQLLTLNALAASYQGSSPSAYKTIKEWPEQADLARAPLDKAAKKMKK
uniref:Retrotransposon gag domain-containing protein n=1 Tax=Tanacetum cinerariifolium TaxID=118510 RepID=A0A6L2JL20_TANCI|nr:hypothetical protein [Tanacetum cinerariifolium]